MSRGQDIREVLSPLLCEVSSAYNSTYGSFPGFRIF